MGSIYERLEVRSNSLNFLRLLLAGLVIVSHASPIGGLGEEFQISGLTVGNIAVGGFFAISGYLITSSRFGSDFLPYAWRRFLRIFPGYWVCLAVVGLIFGALAGAVRGGWTIEDGLAYFESNLLMVFGGVPFTGSLEGAPFPINWNGSMWTLRYELVCYIAVGLALFIPFVRRSRVVVLAAFVVMTAVSLAVQVTGAPLIVRDIALLVPYFLAGATLYRYSDRIPVSRKFAAGALALLAIVLTTGFGKSLAPMPIAYLCMWLGIVLPSPFRRIGARNDISYGVYLYGFPVQQLLVLVGAQHLGLPIYAILGLVAVIPFAAASWFLVERPAMRLKNLWEQRPAKDLQAHAWVPRYSTHGDDAD